MKVQYCGTCGRRTGHKRSVGIATFFMVLLTFGFWILLIPFYPTRCVVCGLTKYEATSGSLPKWQQFIIVFLLLSFLLWYFGK